MSKRVVEVNWTDYATTFPDHYFDLSSFDEKVQAELALREHAEVLDIGGGKHGTTYIKQDHLTCWLLDPGINTCPDWMHGNLDWADVCSRRFDCIIARESFNYLSRAQIQMIPELLKPGGWFMCNTFYRPCSGSRAYTNSRTGVCGIERFVYRSEDDVMEHELEPDEQDYIIKHTFFVYNLDDIIGMLGTERLQFEFLRANSLCISLYRDHAD